MSPGPDGSAPVLIGNIKRLCQGWSGPSAPRDIQSFPLAFTGSHGNVSSKKATESFKKVITSINDKICLTEGSEDVSDSPIQHLHTQVYHRSRVTLRRTQAVQDLSMGLHTPRIALRSHRIRTAKNIIRRIHGPHALGMDGEASRKRFHQNIRDMPRGMRYESMIIIDMALVQDRLKDHRSVNLLMMRILC